MRNSPKKLAVLDAAAAKANWRHRRQKACHAASRVSEACGSYCAQVVEVSVEPGKLRVHRVISAIDPGHVVNPLSIEMQKRGRVIIGAHGRALRRDHIKDGSVEQENFDDYRDAAHRRRAAGRDRIVPSGGFWGGVGEPPVPPVAPALCNAIFAATGKRIRSLPLKNNDLG